MFKGLTFKDEVCFMSPPERITSILKFFDRNKQHTGIDQRLLIIETFKKRAKESLFFI